MPLVSVIIPNYNHAKYLNQRIDAVLNQTFQDFELIILDDKSPDHSLEIIEQYRNHPKVSHIVVNEINSGSTFKQWNKGAALAKGEWIWLAESDDYCDSNFLYTLLEISKNNPNTGVIFSNSYYVDEEGNKINNPYSNPEILEDEQYTKNFVANGRDFCGRYILGPIIGNASSAIFKKDLFEKIGGADVNFRLCGDWKMWHEMLLHTDLGYCSEKLNYFRNHIANVRSTKGVQIFFYELTRIVPSFIDKLNFNASQKEITFENLFRQWVYWVGKNGSKIPLNYRYEITKTLLIKDSKFLFRLIRWLPEKILKIISKKKR